jgi:hypothetical protein
MIYKNQNKKLRDNIRIIDLKIPDEKCLMDSNNLYGRSLSMKKSKKLSMEHSYTSSSNNLRK